MSSLKTWSFILSSITERIPVILLYVLDSSGSSPGRRGFFMAVNDKNEMEGSIGGGIMEHKFVEMARERLKTDADHWKEIKKQVHDKSASKNQSGMICSGDQTIFLYSIQEKDLPAIKKLVTSLEKNQNGCLQLSANGIEFSDEIPLIDAEWCNPDSADWIYREKTGYKNQLYIIGGGHCSLALSKLMRGMDFYIRIYDDRPGLKTMMENDSAHEKHVVTDYTSIAELIPSGSAHYVVIMTLGYRSDDMAIRALIGKEFRYIGVLGSQSKMQKMMQQYRAEGISSQWLDQVHAPVGIAINSQTPEEIAVSIAAALIAEKNKIKV